MAYLFLLCQYSIAQYGEPIHIGQLNIADQVVAGDLDNDGKKDLVNNQISWYRHHEKFQFGPANDIGPAAKAVELSDLDNNGWLDVIAYRVFDDSSSLVWYPNLGNGEFGNEYFITNQALWGFLVADFTGDGFPDIAAHDPKIFLFKNEAGTGPFSSQPLFPNLSGVVNHGDPDLDGDQDIFLLKNGKLQWLNNEDGLGTFSFGGDLANYYSTLAISKWEKADFNLDGKDDMILLTSDHVTTFMSTSSLLYTTSTSLVTSSEDPRAMAVFTVGEGQVPRIIYKGYTPTIKLSPEGTVILNMQGASNFQVTDLDNDGHHDLLFKTENEFICIPYILKVLPGTSSNQYDLGQEYDFLYDLGDINGDNLVDLVSCSEQGIFKQTQLPGKQVMKEVERLSMAKGYNLFKLLDWDSDNDLDIIYDLGAKIYCLENTDGQGSFAHLKLVADSVRIYNSKAPGIADADGDGDIDIIAEHSADPGLFFWENDGQGQLIRHPILENYGFNGLKKLAVADMGKDGDLDLLVAYEISSIQPVLLYLENQNGNWIIADTVSNNNFGTSFTVVEDFNGDGNVTLINYSHIFQYNPASHAMDYIGDVPNLINVGSPDVWHTGDYDGDGDKDLCFKSNIPRVAYWRAYENGTFSAVDQVLIDSVGGFGQLDWLDMDADGDMDLCVLNNDQDYYRLAWHESTSTGFEGYNIRPLMPYALYKGLDYGDMDNDGDLDQVGIFWKWSFWRENYDGNGHFSTPRRIGPYVEFANYGSNVFHCYDKESDGDQDFTVNNYVYTNEGNSAFSRAEILGLSAYASLTTAKIDADEYPELLVPNGSIYAYNATAGTYGFSAYGNYYNDARQLDVDRDGDLDFVSINSSKVIFTQNLGNGSFGQPTPVIQNIYASSPLGVGDLNQDGYGDLVLCLESTTKQLFWYPSIAGSGYFGEPQFIASDVVPSDIFTKDMDGDGDVDVVMRNFWYENQGTGNFVASHQLCADLHFNSNDFPLRALTDMNGDGVLDLLFNNQWIATDASPEGTDWIVKCLSRGNSDIRMPVIAHDADGDGDEDLILGEGGRINWFENTQYPSGIQIGNKRPWLEVPLGSIVRLISSDVNGDGKKDVAFIATLSMGWFKNLGSGVYTSPIVVKSTTTSQPFDTGTLLDFDNDGDQDFLTDKLVMHSNQNSIAYGNVQLQNAGHNIKHLLSADMNGNGGLDILYFSENDDLYRMQGFGNIGFSSPSLLLENVNKDICHIADFDHDGKIDILYAVANGPNVQFILKKNSGDGNNFTNQVIWQSNQLGIDYLDYTDFNNDQLKDVFYHVWNEAGLRWVIQTSPGVFKDTILPMGLPIDFKRLIDDASLDAIDNVKRIINTDLDGDHDLDMVVLSDKTKRLEWRENLLNNPVVSGQCFIDWNQNALLDAGEVNLRNAHTKLDPMALLSFPDSAGITKYFVEQGDWELGYEINSNLWALTTDSVVFHVEVDTLPFQANYRFGFAPILDTVAVEPFLVSAPTRCNFSVPFWLTVKNTGTTNASGQIRLVKDAYTQFETADVMPDDIIADTIIWQLSSLPPTHDKAISLSLKMPNESNVGRLMNFKTIVAINDNLTGETHLFNHNYQSELRCAIDPNDKLVNPNRTDQYGDNLTLFGEQLEYTIRFQNTGNDTAFHITLTDQLDPNLDWATFQPVAASHYNETTLDSNGLLKVFFRNILLPDTATNEPASHGFFSYTIRPKQGLPENTGISNTANIYFDYNLPIVTNTTVNVMVSSFPTTADKDRQEKLGFRVYPNPIAPGRSLVLESPWETTEVQLSDVLGREVIQQKMMGKLGKLELPTGISGPHFLTFSNGEERQVFKLVILE